MNFNTLWLILTGLNFSMVMYLTLKRNNLLRINVDILAWHLFLVLFWKMGNFWVILKIYKFFEWFCKNTSFIVILKFNKIASETRAELQV